METLSNSPETTRGPEQSAELEKMATERLEQLKQSAERAPEKVENKAEKAREIIERQPEPEPVQKSEKSQGRGAVTRLDKALSYKHTMMTLQRHMKPATRAFSKFIHQPVVEKASDVVGQTVLRPSVTLGASSTAVLVGGFLYIAAKHYGYGLSGSVFILSLLIGGVLGLAIELITKLSRKVSGYFRH